MSVLTIYLDDQPKKGKRYTDFVAIERELAGIDVKFERWTANRELTVDDDQATIISAYQESIDKLKQLHGFQSVDVINLSPDHPQKAEFRQKFLAEHTHDDFEVRFFIDGCGLFYLHVNSKVYAALCEKGDLISVPANTTHWFDMGENPSFKVIRLFTTQEGWVAKFTGSDIAKIFPTFDETVAELKPLLSPLSMQEGDK
ncbi:MAG: cupin [Methyloglobulus sp.]|nr:cupin [Pseudomonadota bacterium]MSS75942.1 cupin [Methyloglobulus sp.]